ncbi:TetR/AcrR family transcriptional regulator C-terminal domain-containing protein [Mycobacterium sp. ITM-2016-00316]|uniref:TetR/AcrR family transcriptional regulator C-terminal domain-containing protein n=1 Tax=Mycobacterium sp. ITM-2016-00316 TaxID=2099695 RepID=UPI000CF9EA5A|nr:TetR/AcrR family transcriptional regulator C-terminal domain-containing protein [Mycobacterium sp. ITM-2016-00316]WNG82380.1 TetR/AcrR family transcriptional regulator C-terminal domain-containing protein [Mycobacterium sp. ITM-2016-00316]
MGRPKVAILSSDLIATAAMDLVNRTGGFTIPELARTLKVSPSSLYNHVSGREQIIELLREKAMSEVRLPDLAGPWIDVVGDIVRSYYRSYARYPRLIPLMTAYPVGSHQAVAMYNALAVTLTGAGFTAADTLRIITLIDSFVLGSALDAAAPAAPWGDGGGAGPELAAALATGAAAADRPGDAFEFGLQVLLRGVSRP